MSYDKGEAVMSFYKTNEAKVESVGTLCPACGGGIRNASSGQCNNASCSTNAPVTPKAPVSPAPKSEPEERQ